MLTSIYRAYHKVTFFRLNYVNFKRRQYSFSQNKNIPRHHAIESGRVHNLDKKIHRSMARLYPVAMQPCSCTHVNSGFGVSQEEHKETSCSKYRLSVGYGL